MPVAKIAAKPTCLFVGLACLLPILAIAQEKPAEFVATQLSGTLTLIKGGGGNVVVSAGEDGVYLIDDEIKPLSDALLGEIRKISDQPIRFVINTHYHGDHVGGNETMGNSGAIIIAHDNVLRRMSTEQFNNFRNDTTEPWPLGALPVITFSEEISLNLNAETARVYHVANGHTDGDAIIHFPVSNVIHMGDVFFNGRYPFIDLDAGGSLQGMLAGVDMALGMANEDTRIVPGHGPPGSSSDLLSYRDFLVRAGANVQQLIDQGMSLEHVIMARPTAEWDETMGKIWITPEQMVTFIYNSLQGVPKYTRLESNSAN